MGAVLAKCCGGRRKPEKPAPLLPQEPGADRPDTTAAPDTASYQPPPPTAVTAPTEALAASSNVPSILQPESEGAALLAEDSGVKPLLTAGAEGSSGLQPDSHAAADVAGVAKAPQPTPTYHPAEAGGTGPTQPAGFDAAEQLTATEPLLPKEAESLLPEADEAKPAAEALASQAPGASDAAASSDAVTERSADPVRVTTGQPQPQAPAAVDPVQVVLQEAPSSQRDGSQGHSSSSNNSSSTGQAAPLHSANGNATKPSAPPTVDVASSSGAPQPPAAASQVNDSAASPSPKAGGKKRKGGKRRK